MTDLEKGKATIEALDKEPEGNGPHDNRAEELEDWYEHYMAISVEELALDFMLREACEDGEPPLAMRIAAEDRIQEAKGALMGGGE